MRDVDGFICLTPRVDEGRWAPSIKPKVFLHKNPVGDNPILSGEEDMRPKANNTNTYRFLAKQDSVHIDYKPKTWQYKAWSTLKVGLDFNAKSQFRHVRHGNRKLKHILRIGLALKVRGADPVSGKPVLDQLSPYSSKFGIYSAADTPDEFIKLMDRWYRMVYDNIKTYRDMAIKLHVSEFVYIPKIFIIYDDMTFDTQTGDPRYLYEMLGLKTDKKGHVIL
ncbi:MAG: hypothetical protein NC489_09105 [Ruminococcus flavefaciens]|nr:hypothetical protein [Ruminococcus flavefaciens]